MEYLYLKYYNFDFNILTFNFLKLLLIERLSGTLKNLFNISKLIFTGLKQLHHYLSDIHLEKKNTLKCIKYDPSGL